MEGRKVWVAFVALIASMFLLVGSASASKAHAAGTAAEALCKVTSLPSFVDQGEGTLASTVGDIVNVECNPEIYGSGQKLKITANQLFSRCKGKITWITPTDVTTTGPGVTVTLDDAGNAIVGLIAGPGCAAGESLISAHELEVPHETVTTVFKVLPPANTPVGVTALTPPQGSTIPLGSEVEDDINSAVLTIFQVELPAKYAQKTVHIADEELFSACGLAPHMVVIGESGKPIPNKEGSVTKVPLDNNGNAFVMVLGDKSCAEGPTLVEADLESTPFITKTTEFTVLSPRVTEF
jgi:hypothetical protein